MATVNFSVPDEVRERFNKAFENQNKSQIIAALMVRAVEGQALKTQRARAIDALLSRRARRPAASAVAVRKARSEGPCVTRVVADASVVIKWLCPDRPPSLRHLVPRRGARNRGGSAGDCRWALLQEGCRIRLDRPAQRFQPCAIRIG